VRCGGGLCLQQVARALAAESSMVWHEPLADRDSESPPAPSADCSAALCARVVQRRAVGVVGEPSQSAICADAARYSSGVFERSKGVAGAEDVGSHCSSARGAAA
jgi:hypothetical protein